MPGPSHNTVQLHTVNLLIIAGLIITLLAMGMTYREEIRWVGHAVAGVFSLILVISIVTTGAMITGRIKSRENVQVFSIHKTLSIWFSIFVIGSFLSGLAILAVQGEPVLATSHGILGLIIALLATFQLISNFITSNRASLRGVHRTIGYLLVPLVTLQLIAGLYVAVI